MEAKHDVTVTDASGLTRKVFAGSVVPVELEGAYRQAVGKAERAPEIDKAEKAPEVDKAVKAPETRKSRRRSN